MSHTTDALPVTADYRGPTERKDPLMAPTRTVELERVAVGAPHRDNSGLRARLSGQTVQPRSIEAELRAAMEERQTKALVVDVRENKRWR